MLQDKKAFDAEGGQGWLVGGLEHELSEETHEIVSEDSEAEGGLASPEVLEVEALDTEVVFELLDSVFGISAIAVETPDC